MPFSSRSFCSVWHLPRRPALALAGIALERLANDVLHFNKKAASLPEDIERQLVKHLDVLRRLIEGAPGMPLLGTSTW
jgi:hypothetical protein